MTDFNCTEKYRDIPGWPGYKAGCDGSVWSFRRSEPIKLSPFKRRNGYFAVGISRLGCRKSFEIHVLVLAAFRGPRPPRNVSRHLDGDRLNNCIENLEYGTQKQNMEDCERHGRIPHGERSWNSKLTQAQVDEIRDLFFDKKMQQIDIARKMGIQKMEVSDILRGKKWRRSANGRVKKSDYGKKLREADVVEIKSLLDDRQFTQQQIADRFGVSFGTISAIELGKIWKNAGRDMAVSCVSKKKPRGVRLSGDSCPASRLTLEKVEEIRRMYFSERLSQKEISRIFDVSPMTIGNIVLGRTWKQSAGGRVASPSFGKKLRESEAIEIKRLLATGSMKQNDIAKKFGFSPKLINSIATGRTWAKVAF